MQDFQFRYRLLPILSMMSLLTLTSFGLPSIASANTPDPNQGLPDGTLGGGSRSGTACSSQDPLLAFVPDSHVLKTTESQITLWFHLPDSDILTNAELIIYDEQGSAVVDTTFSVAEQSGLFGVNLTSMPDGEKLDLNKDYRWFFSLICPDDRAADISVDGWIQSTALPPSFMNELNAVPPLEQANLYVQEGLWSEAMMLLMDSQVSQSTTTPWVDSWDSIIQAISPAPISLNFATASQLDVSPDLY